MPQINSIIGISVLACIILFSSLNADARAQINEPYNPLEHPFSLELTCGYLSGVYSNKSSVDEINGAFTSSNINYGVGLTSRFDVPQIFKTLGDQIYWQVGYFYDFPADSTQVSYARLDGIGYCDFANFAAGINYSFWNNDITGGIGGQAEMNVNITSTLSTGLMYIYMPGTGTSGGYNSKYEISCVLFKMKWDI